VRAECVAALEDVLDLDEEPYDPKRPQGNFDATRQPRMAEPRVPRPAKPGKPALYAYAYQRNGTRTLCMCCEPQVGWRPMVVPKHRTLRDFAHPMPWLVDERYPEADMMRGVLDHLNTPNPASLYEAFEPVEARRILQQLAFHDTPKHGSWLHRAEIAVSSLQGQCRDRRLPDAAMLTREITAYEDARHAAQATIVWRFTTTKAREKLRRLYPSNSK
jgi:DDE superfamily endonuclease